MFLKIFNILESCSWGLELIYTHLWIMVPVHPVPCCEVVLIMVYLIFKYSVQRQNENIFSGSLWREKMALGMKE